MAHGFCACPLFGLGWRSFVGHRDQAGDPSRVGVKALCLSLFATDSLDICHPAGRDGLDWNGQALGAVQVVIAPEMAGWQPLAARISQPLVLYNYWWVLMQVRIFG